MKCHVYVCFLLLLLLLLLLFFCCFLLVFNLRWVFSAGFTACSKVCDVSATCFWPAADKSENMSHVAILSHNKIAQWKASFGLSLCHTMLSMERFLLLL